MIRSLLTAFICVALFASGVGASEPTAFVINTSGETLSEIDISTMTPTNNVAILGSDINCYPNQIVVRDTLAWIVNSGTDEIQVINLNTMATVGWIDFPAGSNPYWMAFLDDHYCYVSLLVDNSLAKVDVTNKNIVETYPIGQAPEGVVIVDNLVCVSVTAYDFSTWSFGQGRVVVFDPLSETIVGDIPVGTNPQYMALDSQNRVHVSCTGNYGSIAGMVYIIDTDDFSIADSLAIGGQPAQVAISSDNVAYLAAGGWLDDGEVYSYDALGGTIFHDPSSPIYIDSGATGVVVYQDATVFATCFGDKLVRLNEAGDKINTLTMGDGPVHLDFNYRPGDANGDWEVNIGDAVYVVNYIFKSGAAPLSPRWRANPNGDEAINVGDAVYLVNYIFKGGPGPKIGPIWIK